MPGTDLREGVHTLPVLYALRETGPDADRLARTARRPDRPTTTTWPRRCGCCAPRRASPRPRRPWPGYAVQAEQELAQLPDGPGRQALATLVEYTINRHG